MRRMTIYFVTEPKVGEGRGFQQHVSQADNCHLAYGRLSADVHRMPRSSQFSRKYAGRL